MPSRGRSATAVPLGRANSFLLGLLVHALAVALDVPLGRAGYREGAIRHVLRDDRPGASVRRVPDVHRRDEGGVHAGVNAVADGRASLAAAVVVGGDRAGAEVGVRADVGIADVG